MRKSIPKLRRNVVPSYKTSGQSTTLVGGTKLDFSWTALVSLILTAFTAVAFGSGQAYRNAYSSPFNFDSLLIPWSFQDTVYLGVVKQIDVILLAPIWALIGLIVLIGIFIFFVALKNLSAKKKNRPKNKSEIDQFELDHPFVALFLTFLTRFFIFGFIVIILGTYFVVNAEKLGINDSKSDMEAILNPSKPENEKAKKELRWVEIRRIVEKQDITENGYLIDCNEHVCGIYSPKFKRVF